MLLVCYCRALAFDTAALSASMQQDIMQITQAENATQIALACDRWVVRVADAVKSSIEEEGKFSVNYPLISLMNLSPLMICRVEAGAELGGAHWRLPWGGSRCWDFLSRPKS